VQKLKNHWPEIVFFFIALAIGILSQWNRIGQPTWLLSRMYLMTDGYQFIPRNLLNNPLFVFSFFWIATIFAYLFSYEIFKSRKWSFLVIFIFYYTPLLAGLAFFDVNNTPMLCFMMMGLFILLHIIKRPTFLFAILLAVVNGLAIFTHPIMLMFPIAIVGFYLLNVLNKNVQPKDLWKLLVFVVLTGLIILFLMLKLDYWQTTLYKDFLPSFFYPEWYAKLEWFLIVIPPLWILYFLFSIVILNILYFTNYFEFLKSKWIYTFLFTILVLFLMAPYILPKHFLLMQAKNVFAMPSFILLGVAGCYEFSIWVRRKWGEKVYFIFKYTFLAVFALQCFWVVIAMIWLHPEYHQYRNWPLFFI